MTLLDVDHRKRIHFSAPGRERQIGPVGTASRIVVGVIAITVPIALDGIGWQELAALIAFPVVATVAARLILGGYEHSPAGTSARSHGICSGPACLLIGVLLAIAFALGALTPVDGDVVFWVFLGASMLLAAVRGYAGCEVLAFPNALTGRADTIGCILFGPIDAAEAPHHRVAVKRAVHSSR